MIRVRTKGDFKKTKDFLKKLDNEGLFSDLDAYGVMGVDALSAATPIDTGLSAASWNYRIFRGNGRIGIQWYNTDVIDNGTPVVILLQYGHGTGTGGYVQGRDFINPAMRPVFDQIASDIRKKVTT